MHARCKNECGIESKEVLLLLFLLGMCSAYEIWLACVLHSNKSLHNPKKVHFLYYAITHTVQLLK